MAWVVWYNGGRMLVLYGGKVCFGIRFGIISQGRWVSSLL